MLTFDAGDGTDVLTIFNPAVGLFAPVDGIVYHGGGNVGDALEMLGGTADSEVYNIKDLPIVGAKSGGAGAPAVIGGDGEFQFTGKNNLRLSFTGLAPITDTVVAGSLTVNATDGANTISITNGALAPQLRVSVDAFEPIDFDNKTTLIVNGGDGTAGGDAADTITVNFTNAPTGLTGITVNADEGTDVVNVRATNAAVPLVINSGADLDVVNVGNDGTVGSPGLLTPIAGAVTINGGAGGANLTVDGSGAAVNADYAITGTTVTRSIPAGFGGVNYSNSSSLFLTTGSGANVISVNSTSILTNISTNGGDDTVVFANGVTLNGGAVDGGLGADTLDYGAYTTAVSVNLGSNAPGGVLSGTLEGAQENPGQVSTATGTVSVTYNAVAKTYNISAAVSNLLPAAVTGYHIHRASVGVNGPIIVDLAAIFGLGALTADGSGGFTFNATGVSLPAGQEAAFLGGVTYFNVHTAAAPGGLIRGQILPSGVFTATTGTATGTASVAGFENVTGGTGADSLVGDLGVNILRGGGGNDTIVGAPGNDTLDGGDNSDTLVWSNGDNNDVIDGGLGTDTVQLMHQFWLVTWPQ